MKRRASSWAVAALMVSLVAGVVHETKAAEVSFGFFYSNLQPHGSWVVSANYGQVWLPHAHGPGWNPYYDGHWVYTELGWTWVSDYPWGAIPYHYGTWTVDPVLGWIWVPGYVWAPSWVVFCSGPGYIEEAFQLYTYIVSARRSGSVTLGTTASSSCRRARSWRSACARTSCRMAWRGA